MKRNLLKTIVCMMLIAMTVLTPITASAASMAHILKVNTDSTRLREGPGDTEIIAKLDKGDKVLYWGSESRNYCKVVTMSGKTGYIYEEYLSAYGTVKQSMVHVTEGKTPFYKKSGDSLKKNGSIADDTMVLVYKTNGSWAYVKTITGKSGYCKLSYLKDVF